MSNAAVSRAGSVFSIVTWLGALGVLAVIAVSAISRGTGGTSADGGASGSRLASASGAWACEMGCEGSKLYPSRGACPVCAMALARASERAYRVELSSAGPLVVGRGATLRVRLSDADGRPARLGRGGAPGGVERPLALVIASDDLQAHEAFAPAEPGGDGSWAVSFTPKRGGRHVLFAAFRPEGLNRQMPMTAFNVEAGDALAVATGEPSSPVSLEPTQLVEDFDEVKTVQGIEFRVRCNGSKYFAGAGEVSYLRFALDREAGPVTSFGTIEGGSGSAIIVKHDLSRAVHTHAMDVGAFVTGASGGASASDPNAHVHNHAAMAGGGRVSPITLGNGKPSDVAFQCVFPEAGLYRVFAIFRPGPATNTAGEKHGVVSAAFTINALPIESRDSSN